MDDDAEAEGIYTLLTDNHVDDVGSMFGFNYSVELLRWSLKLPGFLRKWHLGVRVEGSCELIGFITGIPANIQVCERLAPVLIKEIGWLRERPGLLR